MRVERDTSGRLVVTNIETFLAVLLVLNIAGAIAVWFAPIDARTAAGWTATFGVFALALTAAQERSSFVFDGARGLLIWRKRTPFRNEGGELTLDDVTGLSLESDHSVGQHGTARRLVILTRKGPIPVTTAFTGVGRGAEQAGELVRSYLAEQSPPRQMTFVR